MTAPTPSPEAAAAARELLRRSGFTRAGIQDVLGVSGDVLSRSAERPVYLRRLSGDGALELLIRLFLLDVPVESELAERVLEPAGLEALVALGAVEESGSEVRGALRLVPHGDILVASDLPQRETDRADHVAGVHRPSITLADLTVRAPVGRALDVGTGCGIQAMLVARHAERVVATDVNERALEFAALNLALNGIENVELRHGSFFEPVAGETFGLAVCNPPYVISPESEYLFRDSGLGRDRVSERLVGELPRFLDEGGFATIMVSWIQEGDDPSVRPRAWLGDSGCDAWVLHTRVEDPLTTAAAWNRDQADDETGYAAAIDRWLDYFRAEGIESLAYGGIILRRRAGGTNWLRNRELPNEPREDPAAHVRRLFAGVDASEASSDADLREARLSLADGVTLERLLRRSGDGWLESADITIGLGIPFVAELDGVTAGFIAQLDGSRTIGEIIEAVVETFAVPRDRLLASGTRIARDLLEAGFAELDSQGAQRP